MKQLGKTIAVIAVALAMIAGMTSCGSGSVNSAASSAVASSAPATAAASVTTAAPAAASETAASPDASLPPLQIDMYDAYGNMGGVMSGWYGKLLKDNFNMEINDISPNVAGGGDTLYQTRVAAGNLGDLILASNADLADCYKAGLLMDITGYVQGKQNLAKFSIATQNTAAVLGTGDKVYGIAKNASLMPPTTPVFNGQNPDLAPFMRWDYYKELGYPDMKNYDDLLNVLKQMQANHPTSDSGKKVYGISLFKDWDGDYSAFAMQFAYMYGYQEEAGVLMFNADASQSMDVTDENGPYYKTIQLLFKANTMGLLDPDSPSNTWDSLGAKVKDNAVLFQPWPWNNASVLNTPDLGNQGIGWALVPCDDMTILVNGPSPYGNNASSFAVGSKAADPQRIVDFLDWLASPAGMQETCSGPEGLAWVMQDGKPVLTDYGKTCSALDSDVPAEYGGGKWNEGACYSNGRIQSAEDINPNTNETYDWNAWSSTVAANQTALTKDWASHYGAADPLEYLQKNNKLVVSPGNNYSVPSPPSDIATKETQCGTAITTASWQMMFAASQDQFDSIWNNMKGQLDGLGYQDVVKFYKDCVTGYHDAIQQTLAATGSGS